jgi:FkbM family methyltransferase
MIENFLNYIPDRQKQYIIFDVGSRDCQQSIEFYNHFPNAMIYAFECNPNTLDICRKNIENYKDRITLIEGAVCDHDGEITFYPINQQKTITTWADGNPGASSMFKSNGTYAYETYIQDEIKTKAHRLDTVMKLHTIPTVDIVWMDLQGAELLALKGLGSFINSVEYVHTEISHKEMYTGQVLFNELNTFMTMNNFIIKNPLSLTGWQEDVIYQKINRSYLK